MALSANAARALEQVKMVSYHISHLPFSIQPLIEFLGLVHALRS
jgi:hypothetical protein